ncbi:hypothetical protein AB0F91_37880 [Amycolatopsis sp. NPDC023774]|uniref:hypothetical protein n=1 Tax=Amycolatopsis sp. NPDC023774 TaxID=3155015 RepID=UPI0033E57E7B
MPASAKQRARRSSVALSCKGARRSPAGADDDQARGELGCRRDALAKVPRNQRDEHAAAVAAAAVFAAVPLSSAAAQEANHHARTKEKPTIVLVPGAFADTSSCAARSRDRTARSQRDRRRHVAARRRIRRRLHQGTGGQPRRTGRPAARSSGGCVITAATLGDPKAQALV